MIGAQLDPRRTTQNKKKKKEEEGTSIIATKPQPSASHNRQSTIIDGAHSLVKHRERREKKEVREERER